MEKELRTKILDYLDCDSSLIAHYENTFYIKEAKFHTLRQKMSHCLEDLVRLSKEASETEISKPMSGGPPKPSKTLKDYNDWRNTRLKSASVEEKLEWNNIRRAIITYNKWHTEQTDANHSTYTEQASEQTYSSWPDGEKLYDKINEFRSLQLEADRLERSNRELWTQIVNYRTTLNIGNTIRALLD